MQGWLKSFFIWHASLQRDNPPLLHGGERSKAGTVPFPEQGSRLARSEGH